MKIIQTFPGKNLSKRHKVDYNSWPIDCLANYNEKLQRNTIKEKSKDIFEIIRQVNSSFMAPDSYFLQLEHLFTQTVNRLSEHMLREERLLFPFIREIIQAGELNNRIKRLDLDKIDDLIGLLNDEHFAERGQIKLSRQLTEHHLSISNSGKPVKRLLTGLAEFEHACELHIHLQCNFLFPKIIALKYGIA